MSLATQPPSPNAAAPASGLRRRLLGSHPRQQDGIRRLAHMIVVDVCCLLLLGLISLAGFVPAVQAASVAAYCALGWALLYGLIRSGRTIRRDEAWSDTVVAAYGMSTVVFAYATLDVVRGLALQLVCLVLVMHIDRLRLRQAMLLTIGSVAALIATLAGLQWLTPGRIDLRTEIHNLMLATTLLPIAVLLINEAHRVSSRARQHSGQLGELLATLRAESLHDEFTGLPNARHMHTLIEHEIKRHGRHGQPFCLTLLDVTPNDPDSPPDLPAATQRELAELVALGIGPADTLALWSPGRWLLAQPATGLADASDVVERILQAARRHDWSHGAQGPRVSLSAGSTEHQFSDTLDSMLSRATRALERARGEGAGHHATEPVLPPGTRGSRALLNQLG
uniref:GGDEF domain-containing protein n=1 Tax=Aquabacterium sp. TaxID=1872578 RepID=UPI0035AE2D6A